jgi:hypothetical protein
MDSSPGMFLRVLAFLQALFLEVISLTKDKVTFPEGLGPLNTSEPFAKQFRIYMNYGMTMGGHGEFRVQFYDRVVQKAHEVCITSTGCLTILTQER